MSLLVGTGNLNCNLSAFGGKPENMNLFVHFISIFKHDHFNWFWKRKTMKMEKPLGVREAPKRKCVDLREFFKKKPKDTVSESVCQNEKKSIEVGSVSVRAS